MNNNIRQSKLTPSINFWVFCILGSLFVSNVMAEKNNVLPTVKFTKAAENQAKAMIENESDSRAVLTLIKGNFESLDSTGEIMEKKFGWMLRIVNREQFTDEPRKVISGLEVLLPQEHLYHELDGVTLDFSNNWWVLTEQ